MKKDKAKTNKKKAEREYTLAEFKKVFLGEKDADSNSLNPKDFGKRLADRAIRKINDKVIINF